MATERFSARVTREEFDLMLTVLRPQESMADFLRTAVAAEVVRRRRPARRVAGDFEALDPG